MGELKYSEIKWVTGSGNVEDQSSEKTSVQSDIDISPTWKDILDFIYLTRENGAFQEEEIAGTKEERSDILL